MKTKLIKKIKSIVGKDVIQLFYRSLFFLSDEDYVKVIYRLRMGKKLDLSEPKTFSEKLQYLKVYDHNPKYSKMAGKLSMREYVANTIGEGHTVPILGVWDSFDSIDFDTLPEEFVLKTTHDSGSYAICRDKNKFDYKNAKKVIERSLKKNYYRVTREWQYKDIDRKVIAEILLKDNGGTLTDYKFFCFNGEPHFMYIERESDEHPLQAIFDMDFNRLPFTMEDEKWEGEIEKPACFSQMIDYAAKLSASIPFLRVDMYEVNGVVYIGELTFYHYGGYVSFNPPEWDSIIGSHLDTSCLFGEKK
ncbi:MAG: ATP-grasp fold amidoligase family protein [Candidatus Ornithospirochaeta sp.]